MKTRSNSDMCPSASVAATVAGEDLSPGDYITVMSHAVEVPTFYWCSAAEPLSAHELIRLRYIPEHAGQPLKIVTLCLPFVYVRTPDKQLITLDLRVDQIARLNHRVARRVCREFRRATSLKCGE